MRHSVAFCYPGDESPGRGVRSDRLPTSVVPLGRKAMESFVHWERFASGSS
jgi:hypothetical protein